MIEGDEHQLAPTVRDQRAEWGGLSCSLLARRKRTHRGFKYLVMLEIQYCMHRDIQRFPNHQYYNGVLKCGLRESPAEIMGIPWPRAPVVREYGSEDAGEFETEADPRHRLIYTYTAEDMSAATTAAAPTTPCKQTQWSKCSNQ